MKTAEMAVAAALASEAGNLETAELLSKQVALDMDKYGIEQKELNNAIERFLSLQQLTPEESETLATKLGLNTGSAAYPTTTPTPSLGWRIPAVIACVVGWIYYLLN